MSNREKLITALLNEPVSYDRLLETSTAELEILKMECDNAAQEIKNRIIKDYEAIRPVLNRMRDLKYQLQQLKEKRDMYKMFLSLDRNSSIVSVSSQTSNNSSLTQPVSFNDIFKELDEDLAQNNTQNLQTLQNLQAIQGLQAQGVQVQASQTSQNLQNFPTPRERESKFSPQLQQQLHQQSQQQVIPISGGVSKSAIRSVPPEWLLSKTASRHGSRSNSRLIGLQQISGNVRRTKTPPARSGSREFEIGGDNSGGRK